MHSPSREFAAQPESVILASEKGRIHLESCPLVGVRVEGSSCGNSDGQRQQHEQLDSLHSGRLSCLTVTFKSIGSQDGIVAAFRVDDR